jgi:hypothetical protein
MIPTRHVMDPWRDSLLTELRLRQIPGDRIGEALAEVDTYCADSGQTPAEAFGDPITYAESLVSTYAAAPMGAWERVWRPTALAFATLAGVFCFLNGIDALAHGDRGVLTAGELLAVALGTAMFPAVISAVLNPALFRRFWAWAGVVIAAHTAMAAPVVLWRTPVMHASEWVLLTVGLFLLAAAWWPTAADRVFADRIIDPRTGSEPFATPRILIAAVRWFLPTTLLIAALVTTLLP